MGARPNGADDDWSLFSCTMTPGFLPSDYEGGDVDALIAEFPAAADLIARLCRPGTGRRLDADRPPD
jgi:predicted cupin superfamily sugar epimerase